MCVCVFRFVAHHRRGSHLKSSCHCVLVLLWKSNKNVCYKNVYRACERRVSFHSQNIHKVYFKMRQSVNISSNERAVNCQTLQNRILSFSWSLSLTTDWWRDQNTGTKNLVIYTESAKQKCAVNKEISNRCVYDSCLLQQVGHTHCSELQ